MSTGFHIVGLPPDLPQPLPEGAEWVVRQDGEWWHADLCIPGATEVRGFSTEQRHMLVEAMELQGLTRHEPNPDEPGPIEVWR